MSWNELAEDKSSSGRVPQSTGVIRDPKGDSGERITKTRFIRINSNSTDKVWYDTWFSREQIMWRKSINNQYGRSIIHYYQALKDAHAPTWRKLTNERTQCYNDASFPIRWSTDIKKCNELKLRQPSINVRTSIDLLSNSSRFENIWLSVDSVSLEMVEVW
jgi:hypothetical protein